MTPKLDLGNKKELMIAKGMMLLWSKGYNATSVNDIVQEAGVPKGSFYFYFKSKEDFAVHVIEHYFDSNFEEIEKIFNDAKLSPKEKVIQSFDFKINYLKNNLNCSMGCLGCNLGNEMAEHSEPIRLAILNKENYIKEKTSELVQQAKDNGEITNAATAEEIVLFMDDAGKGAMITMKEMNNFHPVDNMFKMLKTTILN